jgi:hypothetical protein
MDESGTDDGLFGGSEAGTDSLVGQIEQLVRGGDAQRAQARERLKERGEDLKEKGEELRKRVLDPPKE